MKSRILSTLGEAARRSLGIGEVERRLELIDAKLDQVHNQGRPAGAVYFGDNTVLTATQWGANLLLDTRDLAISPWLALRGQWEADVTAWMKSVLGPGRTFVDIGANVGYFTVLGGKLVGPAGRVVAIEPHPRLAALLRHNVAMNGYYNFTTVLEKAAWSEATRLQFHARSSYLGNSSVGSIGAESLGVLGDTEELIEVEAARLDDLLVGCPKVDVVKLDAEGAEGHALRGLTRTLSANPDVQVLFEWAPALIEAVKDEPGGLLDTFEDLGFRFFSLDGFKPMSNEQLGGYRYLNVIARRER